MLQFLNQKFYKNVAALIGIILVIGNCCYCTQVSLNGKTDSVSKNNEEYDQSFAIKSVINDIWNDINNTVSIETDDLINNDLNSININEILNFGKFKHYLNLSEHPGSLCNRVCEIGETRVCYFKFNLEYYQAMGAACGKCAKGVGEDCNKLHCIVGDGVEKGLMSINRQIPGPAIQVCKGDLIVVDVRNNAGGTAAALHWHGLHMTETPYMDGIPFLTQCPISFGNTFRYQFHAHEAGTQFYHSHSGHHKANGQYGALIVRRAKEPLSIFYDYDLPEHYILISDWMHAYAEKYFPGLPSSALIPDSVLINGRGVYTNPKTKQQTKVRPTIYYVTPGNRYRFRLINSISHACPFQIQIEKHNLTIIASDSCGVLPNTFDTLVCNSGERYDFILRANHTSGDFWIRVKGLGFCTNKPLESFALLRYETNEIVKNENVPPFPKYEEQYPPGKYLNHPNATCWWGENNYCVTELMGLKQDNDLRYATPDHKFFLGFHNHPVKNMEIFKDGEYNHFVNLFRNATVVGAINNISLAYPDYPLLTQPEQIDESQFCDDMHIPTRCVGRRVCHCIHRLKVKLNSIVELILVDETEKVDVINHPFHLHGYRFLVTGMGQQPSGQPLNLVQAKELESRSELRRDDENPRPPLKDTVSIPSRGYAIVRFRANNPGFWLMHCHYEWHLANGMALIMQVGETSEMVKAPKDFPRCGNYIPSVKDPAMNNIDFNSFINYKISKEFM